VDLMTDTAPFVPIHLYATATLSPNSQVAVPAQNLQNPLGGPMEIHEIRFQIYARQPAEAIASLPAYLSDQGALVGVKLDLGSIELTNGFVPAWCLGQDMNENAKNLFINNLPTGRVNQISSYYRWVLPKPLYVPEGATVIPQFQHRGFAPVTVQVGIAYSGRALPRNSPKPQKAFVPWVSSYYSQAMQFSTTATTFDQSSPVDIFNKWDTPIHLQRFTVRSPVIVPTLGQWADWNNVLGTYFDFMQARIIDSSGIPIVRKFTPLGEIVNPQNKTWEISGAVQAPGDFWNVFVKLTPVTVPLVDTTILAQTQMALVGYREA
jgi:hypothetical protein